MTGEPVKETRLVPDTPQGRLEAARVLRAGGLAAFATETVYGLGADATSPGAVAGIYAAKGRPSFNPLIAHVATVQAALALGTFDALARRLAEAFWPGPLTLVVPAREGAVCEIARSGLASVAVRVPGHAGARALLEAVDRPIAAPSANRSGGVSPVEPAHVLADLGGRIDLILDGGRTPLGLESTVVACLGGAPAVLRPGGITTAQIALIAGPLAASASAIAAPGMLASHYAPQAGLRLGASTLDDGELGLDFGARWGGRALDLSPIGDTCEAAANLYDFLRRLDALRPRGIAVAPIPMRDLGEAINDRLRRAAAPRTR